MQRHRHTHTHGHKGNQAKWGSGRANATGAHNPHTCACTCIHTHARTHTCASSSKTLPCWVLMAACAPLSSCTAASGPATARALPARASPGSAAASTAGAPLSPLALVARASRAVAGTGPSGRPSCRTVENGTRAPEAEVDRGRGTVPLLLLPGRWLWLMAGAMTEAPSPPPPPPPPPARATPSLRVGVTDRVRGPGRAWDAVTSATGDANRATRGPATPAPPCPALGPSSWGCRVRRGRGVWDAAADSRAPPWTSPWTLTSPSNAEDTSARPARSSWARGTSAAVWEGCPGSAHHPSRPRTHPAHCSRVMPLQDMQTPLAGPRRAGPARPGDALPRARPEPRTGADRGPVEKGASTRPGRGRGPSRDRREGFVELMRRYFGSYRGQRPQESSKAAKQHNRGRRATAVATASQRWRLCSPGQQKQVTVADTRTLTYPSTATYLGVHQHVLDVHRECGQGSVPTCSDTWAMGPRRGSRQPIVHGWGWGQGHRVLKNVRQGCGDVVRFVAIRHLTGTGKVLTRTAAKGQRG